ncbi:hypothetical protein LEMLEM_LOCUS7842 [Lemmus lemmus]
MLLPGPSVQPHLPSTHQIPGLWELQTQLECSPSYLACSKETVPTSPKVPQPLDFNNGTFFTELALASHRGPYDQEYLSFSTSTVACITQGSAGAAWGQRDTHSPVQTPVGVHSTLQCTDSAFRSDAITVSLGTMTPFHSLKRRLKIQIRRTHNAQPEQQAPVFAIAFELPVCCASHSSGLMPTEEFENCLDASPASSHELLGKSGHGNSKASISWAITAEDGANGQQKPFALEDTICPNNNQLLLDEQGNDCKSKALSRQHDNTQESTDNTESSSDCSETGAEVSEEKTTKQDLVLTARNWIHIRQDLLRSKVGDDGNNTGNGHSVGCLMRRETMATPEQSPLLSAPQLSSPL